MSVPRVSVVIAAFNAEEFIEQSIESILAQSFTDFDCIVVDDASTDRTRDVVTGLAERDSRLVLLESPRNEGPAAAEIKALLRAAVR